MSGYKGRVVFFRDTKHGIVSVFHGDTADYTENHHGAYYVYLGEAEVDVVFCDTRSAEIEALVKKIENERAESQHKINLMLGKIQELQALEHTEE